MNTDNDARPKFMRFVRRFAVPIIVAWLLLTVAVNVLVPPIESAAKNHAVTMSPHDAPAMIAAKRVGEKFHESDSDSIAMIVLEGDNKLGEEAHRYYDGLVNRLRATPHTCSMCRTCGEIRLLPVASRAAMAKPLTSKSISPVTRAAPWETSPLKRSGKSSTIQPRLPDSGYMSPARQRCRRT